MNDIKYGNKIASQIAENINYYAKHKYSSNVVEKCFDYCDGIIKQKLISNLTQRNFIEDLIFDEHGNYIIQKALSCSDNKTQKDMIQIITTLIDKLKLLPFGERIIVRLYKEYYTFFEDEKNDVLFNEDQKKGRYKYNNGNYLQNGNKSRKYRSNKQNKIV